MATQTTFKTRDSRGNLYSFSNKNFTLHKVGEVKKVWNAAAREYTTLGQTGLSIYGVEYVVKPNGEKHFFFKARVGNMYINFGKHINPKTGAWTVDWREPSVSYKGIVEEDCVRKSGQHESNFKLAKQYLIDTGIINLDWDRLLYTIGTLEQFVGEFSFTPSDYYYEDDCVNL